VLRGGGRLLFTIPFLYPTHEAPADFSRRTRYGVQLMPGRFEAVSVVTRGGVFSVTARYFWLMQRPIHRMTVGRVLQALVYPFLWAFVQLDRFDQSDAFAIAYYGEATKPTAPSAASP